MQKQKEDILGFSYDERWFTENEKLNDYDKYSENYEKFIYSTNLIKIDKTVTLKKYIENSKLENIIMRKPSSPNINEYFCKIKLFIPIDIKKIIKVFLNIKDFNENDDNYLMIDAFLNTKTFDEYKDKKEKIVLSLDTEIREVLFNNYIKK